MKQQYIYRITVAYTENVRNCTEMYSRLTETLASSGG